MGLILREVLESECLLGIWEITEGMDELFHGLIFNEEENERLRSFKSNARKLEWLSVRQLLKELVNHDVKIVYNKDRKPFLSDNSYQISISHSFKYTSILISKTNKVGIDLEYMSHRISSIAHKFMNSDEVITDNPNEKRYHLYIHWCAKEALYKICDKQDINFKQNLTINPFSPTEKGVLKGVVSNRYGTETFDLNYFRTGGYVVVWCAKEKLAFEKLFKFASNDYHI